MFEAGQKVKALIDLMSDDRAAGVDDDSPIVPAGSIGTVLSKSEGCEDVKLKDPNCWVVDWGNVKYDVAPEEMELVQTS